MSKSTKLSNSLELCCTMKRAEGFCISISNLDERKRQDFFSCSPHSRSSRLGFTLVMSVQNSWCKRGLVEFVICKNHLISHLKVEFLMKEFSTEPYKSTERIQSNFWQHSEFSQASLVFNNNNLHCCLTLNSYFRSYSFRIKYYQKGEIFPVMLYTGL